MIRSESEYRDALRRLQDEQRSLEEHEAKLRAMGLPPDQVERGMSGLRTFHLQFAEEVQRYERLRDGDLGCFDLLRDIGRVIIGGRIALKQSQRAFAKQTGVPESQVSRDEKNEYSGITLERACSLLESMNLEVRIECRFRSQEENVYEDENGDYELDLKAPEPPANIEIHYSPPHHGGFVAIHADAVAAVRRAAGLDKEG